MTEQLKSAETSDNSHIEDPAERAKANGFVEPEAPSKEDRIEALVTYIEHAHKHNSPISMHMIREMKDLLGVADEPKPEAPAEAHHETDVA